MEFEIVDQGGNDSAADLEERTNEAHSSVVKVTFCFRSRVQRIIPFPVQAHRVIVSSRCPWFRRALTSGMRESIEKRIRLHDCHLGVFTLFLQFLYSGLHNIDLAQESPSHLADLLVLADR